jgi:8-oxo-dGTP pyrophosphatase MutT (NUDIX family)
MLDLLAGSGDPFSRDQFDPGHFTVGAFVTAEAHILMVHHRRLDVWLEPGGHIDPGDDALEVAAARELLEETGVTARLVGRGIFDVDVHDIPAAKGEPPHSHFNVGYLFAAEMVEPIAAPEVRAASWAPLDRIAELTLDRAILRTAAKMQSL